ncbi:hypothetical protein BVRB_2g042380 [Beta vulgaris subsp. vulgaris]|nr:hypothetical protein BVRB_2g042380 [Beta vulgaris subsp. vulgaris]
MLSLIFHADFSKLFAHVYIFWVCCICYNMIHESSS